MKRQFLFLLLLIFFNSCTTLYNSVPKVDSNIGDYIELQNSISSHPRYINGDTLNIIYREDYNDQDGQLEYKIYNQKQVIVQSNATHSISVKYGANNLPIPLNNIFSGIYTLEVINEKGVKKYLTFLKSV